MAVFALLTDFGIQDPYVAQMKGVLLRTCANATLCDVTHQISPQDVNSAAWVLQNTLPHFPQRSIFLCVVDPGVGTQRAIIAAEIGDWIYVGPDNGLPVLAASRFGLRQCTQIQPEAIGVTVASNTFHGRDIMAPAAARIAQGSTLGSLGVPHAGLTPLPSSVPPSLTENQKHLDASVQYIDHFGNTVLSESDVTRTWLRQHEQFLVSVAARPVQTVHRVATYSQATPKELILLEGSQGQHELAINGGSASKFLGVQVGDALRLTTVS